MDISQVDTGNIPPQAIQALQQSGAGGGDITAILAQLSQMSPDEVSSALQQLGINIDPDTLEQAASNWVDNAAAKQTGEPTLNSAPADGEQPDAVAEDDSSSDTEEAPPSAEPPASSAPIQQGDEGEQAMAQSPRGPRVSGGGGGGRGANMDALISAAMTGGDPSAAPPMRGPGVGSAPRSSAPKTPGSGAKSTAAGDDPRLRSMLTSVYRQSAADSKRGVPTGERGPNTGSTSGRKRNV